MLRAGDTFLAGSAEGPLHLWVAVTPPAAGEVVAVSITTRRRASEPLVVLRQGDHPFIQRESIVAYAYAAIHQAVEIESAFAAGEAYRREPMTQAQLEYPGWAA